MSERGADDGDGPRWRLYHIQQNGYNHQKCHCIGQAVRVASPSYTEWGFLMITVTVLMDRAKAAAGIPSNYRLARVLDVTENTVSNWKHGRKLPDESTALRLAEMAGLDAGEVLASVRAARADAGPVRDVWADVAARLARTAATAAAALVAVTGSPDAGAMTMQTGAAIAQSVYYVKLKMLWHNGCNSVATQATSHRAVQISAPSQRLSAHPYGQSRHQDLH